MSVWFIIDIGTAIVAACWDGLIIPHEGGRVLPHSIPLPSILTSIIPQYLTLYKRYHYFLSLDYVQNLGSEVIVNASLWASLCTIKLH